MDGLSIGLQRLNAAQTKFQLVDLCGTCGTRPTTLLRCEAFTAEAFVQGLASELDDLPGDDDGEISVAVIARALGKALDLRTRGR
ncbi:hypothetical protein [Cellulomonas sp. PSBB021]|uniref:hypothetical protein n=1 Tax=Cellulomonas sp. PSBB021 TaxID=2003551 RepID=UPI0012FD0472|nr:hypothetical protein [Cellulomonas sp. PSBB021]